MKVLRRVACAGAASVAVLAGCGLWGYSVTSGLVRLSQQRREGERAVRAVERLVATVRDAESGQRGYLLTGDPSYLGPYDAALSRIDGAVGGIRRGPPWRPGEADALVADARAKVRELAVTVAMARSGDRAGALAVVRGGRGRDLMTAVTGRAAAMAADGRTGLAAQERRLERQARHALAVIPALGVLSPLVAFASIGIAHVQSRAALRNAALAEAARAEARRNSQLLNAVSHDIRGPLNAVGAFSQLGTVLCDRRVEDWARFREIFDHVSASVFVLRDLLDGYMGVARAERDAVEAAPFLVRTVVDDVTRVARPAAERKGLTLAAECPDGLTATTDRRKVMAVLANLVSNAVKFTDEGRVVVSAWRSKAGLVLTVADTGPGIPDSLVPDLFGDFVQAGNPERNPDKGHGLGLAICRRLADQIGAYVAVDTAEGVGTTFTLVAPDLPVPEGGQG